MFKNLKHLLVAALLAGSSLLQAAETSPEELVQKVSTEVIDAVKADKTIQAGDIKKIIALVDEKILPHLNFQRMTSSAVGRYWRQATPEQQKRLQEEFKTLLVRTYAGALTQVRDLSFRARRHRCRGAHPDQGQRRADPARLPARKGRRHLAHL